jgi:hypothetical protein
MRRLLTLLSLLLFGPPGAAWADFFQPPSIGFVAPQVGTGARYVAPAAPVFYVVASASYGDPTVVPPPSVVYVDFLDGETVIGRVTSPNSETVNGAPAYAFVWNNPPLGMHLIYARVTDTAGYSATPTDHSTGMPISISVAIVAANPPPQVSLITPTTGQLFTWAGYVPLAATASSAQASIRRVEFVVGNTVVAAAYSPPYSAQWTNPPPGDFTLVAKAYDDHGVVAASSAAYIRVLASRPPAVVLTVPSPGATIPSATPLSLSAVALAPNGSIGRVEFYAGTSLVGSVATSPYNYAWASPQAGVLSLTAKAYDLQGASATSAPVAVTVAGGAAPVVSLTSPPAGATFTAPATIVLSATASEAGGGIAKVDFFANGNVVGTATAAPYNATWSGVAAGTYVLMAKATDTRGATANTAAIAITVGNNQPPVVALTEPFPGQVYQAPGDIQISANPTGTSGTIARVDFYGDGVQLGNATAAPYTILWRGVAVGSHTVTATARDSAGLTANSAPATVSVVAALTLQIDAGIDGASIGDDNVTLSGTAQAPSNSAVIVNGQAAALDQSGHFFANNVQLVPGSNTVTLILTTLDGAPVTKTITLVSTAVAPFTVALDKQEGLAPFSTNVTITNRGNVAFQRIELDLNDDGTPEQTLTTLTAGKAVQALSYNNAGTYTLRVTVYDASNTIIYVARRKIRVYLSVELGLKVVNVYKSMVNRLIANNPTSALRCFTGDAQPRYQSIFDALGSTLPSVALKLQTLIDGSVSEDTAELTILQDTTSDQEAIMIHMIRGGDGIWRIENM